MKKEQTQERFNELKNILLEWQNKDGYWTGELSSSALGVAVACVALYFEDKKENQQQIEKGMQWLVANINTDGGFGDSAESHSNISTSLLCYSSLYLNREFTKNASSVLNSIAAYLKGEGIDVHSEKVADSILNHYKTDRTFSVPILAMCALCGIPGKNAFENIPQLPFELALLPRSFYRLLNLSVVSYAIPALVAVGIAIFKHKKKKNPLMNLIRKASIRKTLVLLEKMMPESGGFLEAIPLTAFVSLCLIQSGYKDLKIVENGVSFLKNTQREDGSWPIDIDLSTWVTSLAVKSLRGNVDEILDQKAKNKLQGYYLSIQNKEKHPFNATAPGGWGWTNFSGSVPDGDDTPGAILTMLQLSKEDPFQYKNEIKDACNWLLNLQNGDGGFPTFARGWGKLPFDQSCADLTGHAVLALSKVAEVLKPENISSYKKAVKRGVLYLAKKQREDGSLLPLWFGNQNVPDHSNPVYGTARVLAYLDDAKECTWMKEKLQEELMKIIGKGTAYLYSVQNIDGSWGGDKNVPGTIEETALALSAIMNYSEKERIEKGFDWLGKGFRKNGLKSSPIGLYFASLWYDEKMYPLTAYLEALSRRLELTSSK